MRYKAIFLTASLATHVACALGTLPAHAQMFGSHHARRTAVTSVDTSVSPAAIKRGKSGFLVVTIHLADGFHINAAKTSSPEWIPTKLKLSSAGGVNFGVPIYPEATSVKEPYYAKPLFVYTGTPMIKVPIRIGRAKPGPVTISGQLSYQGCNDKICLPPGTQAISATVTVK